MQHEGEHGGRAGDPGAEFAGVPSAAAPPSPGDRAPLTGREREILGLLAEGLSGARIADHLVLSPETVRTHVRNAMAKLGASTRSQAIAIALRSHEIDDQPVARPAPATGRPRAAIELTEQARPALTELITGLVALYDLDAGAVYLADPDGLGLGRAAVASEASELPEAVPLGQGVLGRVALERRAQLLQGSEATGAGTVLAAPILAQAQLVGLLALLARGSRPVGRTELLLLQALANHVGDVLLADGDTSAKLEQALRRFRTSWSAATRSG
jgi:DNA-binding CsgD family transcriptional regulator